MKRIIVSVATLIMTLGFGVAVTSPAQAQAPAQQVVAAPAQQVAVSTQAVTCRNLVWLNHQDPPSYAHWVSAIQGYRHGHFWTSSDCDGVFIYWGQGLAFEGTGCPTSVRAVLYDRNHNYDRATPWTTDCVGGLPVVFMVGRNREISFDVRHRNPDHRTMESHALYNPVTF